MDNKEIVLRLDDKALAIMLDEIKQKRNAGAATSIGDRFLIRLLDSFNDGTKVFSMKMDKNKLIVRTHDTLVEG